MGFWLVTCGIVAIGAFVSVEYGGKAEGCWDLRKFRNEVECIKERNAIH